MQFNLNKCPECGQFQELMFSNNPIVKPICFHCISNKLDYNNLEHADFFCRTYNLPFDPNMWMTIAGKCGENTFKEYAQFFFEANKDSLYYETKTKDVWKFANQQWEKARTQIEVINNLAAIKESYIQRAMLKWGNKYSFEQLVKLDNLFTSQIKANNITNPLQKEAVRSLCKIQIEIDDAILTGDAKALKDFSASYGVFAKQAQLEDLITETKTDDITTVAELFDYMEKSGFEFKYFDGAPKDEVDQAIQDIQDSNRRLILESTGLAQVLEDMAKKRQIKEEDKLAREAAEKLSIEELMNFHADDLMNIEEEDDNEISQMTFEEDN